MTDFKNISTADITKELARRMKALNLERNNIMHRVHEIDHELAVLAGKKHNRKSGKLKQTKPDKAPKKDRPSTTNERAVSDEVRKSMEKGATVRPKEAMRLIIANGFDWSHWQNENAFLQAVTRALKADARFKNTKGGYERVE